MAAPDVGGASYAEDKIRTTALTKRIRPNEFFLDYDRLRSGFVTDTQFFRVLWENFGIDLPEEQRAALINKYDLNREGRVNYRMFCDIIDQPFNANDLSHNPEKQKKLPLEYLGTLRSVRPLTPENESHIEALLRNLQKYYKYRGINLRTSCEDFDRHHIGVIQESQFYRSFPRPPEVTEEDVYLLVRKYRDPIRPGLVNYLNLHHDLVALGEVMQQEQATSLPQKVDVGSFLPPQPGADVSLQEIFDRICVAVYKNRIRSTEFFKDYDKLRSGVVTEQQFICGLSLAIGKEAQLARPEIQKVVEYYRTEDGRVRYKEFCDMMENAFNMPDLEKKPTLDVIRPPEGTLGRNLHQLSEGEEARLQEVLSQLSTQVRERRLAMYQYFKDFDRSKAYSRVITPTQFGRILHFLSLKVAQEDFNLLCRKFADKATGDVNYPAFVQEVDKEFVNYIVSQGEDSKSLKTEEEPARQISEPNINFDELMARIRHHVLTNRLRVCEYFQDFDPLRSGSITKAQFRRGLSSLQLCALGHHRLTDPQYNALCQYYENPKMKDKVLWTHFTQDVESVFTQASLEKDPNHKVAPQEIFCVPKPGTWEWEAASQDHKELVDAVMERLRKRASQRRVLAKPVFQDFDRHNNGHVTTMQFRQCLTMLELHATVAEMQALEAKFCNDTGFNYLAFLQELQPEEPPTFMYEERLKTLRLANEKGKLPEHDVATDLEGILTKIKTKVFRERIRIHEWMKDYDRLRKGCIRKINFRRALDLCTLGLKESELAILENKYQSAESPDFVDYLQFCDEIESVFTTKGLDKAPLLEVEQFKPPVEWEQNQLAPEMEALIAQCMARLAEQVRKNRIQLFPLFEDYDKVHNGTVSRSQFRRVLSELELATLVATEQEWVCLWQKFDVKVGGKDDVNYIGFCDMIYNLAHFEWRKP